MNEPEKQFESLRQDYLKQKFPGDLGDLVSTENSVQPMPPNKLRPMSQKAGRLAIAFAAVLLLGITMGLLWLNQKLPVEGVNLGTHEIVVKDGSKSRTPTRFFRPKRAVSIRASSSSLNRTGQANPPPAPSLFAKAKKQRPSLWSSGALAWGRIRPAGQGGSRKDERPRKSKTNPKFRYLFRFEPIRYRRS